MSSTFWWFIFTLSEMGRTLAQITTTTLNLGSHFDGSRLTLFDQALTGKSGIDRTFYWNNSKVEPISFITDTNLVERVNPFSFSAPITTITTVHSDLNPSNGSLRILFRIGQSTGPDLLGYWPDVPGSITPITTSLTVSGNSTCTLSNNMAQMDPYVVVCYNDTMRQDSYLEAYNIITSTMTCFDSWNGNAIIACSTVFPIMNVTSVTVCSGGAICPILTICVLDSSFQNPSCTDYFNCTDFSTSCQVVNRVINVTNTGTTNLMYCTVSSGTCWNKKYISMCYPNNSPACTDHSNCTNPSSSCTATTVTTFSDANYTKVIICTGGGSCNTVIKCTITGSCTNVNNCSNSCGAVTNYTNYTGVPAVRLLQAVDSLEEQIELLETNSIVEQPQVYKHQVSKEFPVSHRRVLSTTYRITNTTANVSTPATRTVYVNYTQWKLNNVIAQLSTPEYNLLPQSNDVFVDLNSSTILTNCVASLVPQESDNMTLFLTNNNVLAFYFIWEKPKLNMIITDEYNNTDIIMMRQYANGTLVGNRINYTLNATTNFKLITDVRAVYESAEPLTGLGTTGVIHLIITGLLSTPNDNVTKMWDCWVDASIYAFRGCVFMTGYQLDPLYPISNLLYNALRQYELYFTSRGDPTLVYVSLYTRGATPNRNNTANIPHSLYPMHKLSTYQAGQTLNWGDPNPFNYTFSWNKYKGVYSYYAYPSSSIFNNYKSGLLISDSGLYRFFKMTQTNLNFFYNSTTPNGVETLSLNYFHHNGSNQTTNVSFELVGLNTLTDFTSLGFPALSTKCYKGRVCRIRAPNQPFTPRYGPHLSFTGYNNDAANPRLMVLKEIIALYYNNDGMASPMPPSIQYFFPGFAIFKASDSSMIYDTTKCTIEKTAYTFQYICSSLGLPALPYLKDFNSGDKVVIYYNYNSIYFETVRPQASPAIGYYLITSRFPMNYQYSFNLSANETGPFSGGVMFNATMPVGSFFTWDPVANISRLCVVSNLAVTQAASTLFAVKGCKTIATQPYKLVLSSTAPDTFLSHISNVTKRGFQFVRESVVMWMVGTPSYNVGNDSSLTVDYNELNFNANVLTKAAYCSMGNNFALFSANWKLIFGKWKSTDAVGGKAAYLSENIALAQNTIDIIASKCISELQAMVLLTANGTQIYLTIYNLTDVSNPKSLLALQQRLEETYVLGVNMDNAISYGDHMLYVRVNARTFNFRYDHFDLRFQLVDSTPGPTSIAYKAEVYPYGLLKSQNFSISFMSVAENNTLDILTQWQFNLTSRNPIDQMMTLNGHVWDIYLLKPPYVGNMNLNVNSRIMRMPILNYMLDTSNLATFSSSMIYHSRFAFLGNTTAVIKNFNANSTYLEVKPNKVMAVDQVAWIAYLPYNCHDIALVSAVYPAFTAVLKCSNTVETFLYGVKGTMTVTKYPSNYTHFRAQYNGPRNDPSILTATGGISNPTTDFVAVLYNSENGTSWKYAFRAPVSLATNASAPSACTALAAFQLATNATDCSFTKSQKPNYVTVCVNLSSSVVNFYTMDAGYNMLALSSFQFTASMLPVTLKCASNYTQLSGSYATLRCIFATNIELYMADMDENQNYKLVNYSAGGALATNASNPRIYSICMDYVPQDIAMTQHFIGIIGKQTTTDLTTTYPSWGFHLFHIDSQNTLNFTNQTQISTQYAGLILPKGGGNNPFHLSSIYPYQEASTATNYTFDNTTNTTLNVSVPVHDNYFHLQDGTGNIYTYKADSYMLNANLNNTKLKSYMDSSMFSVDATVYPFSQLTSAITVSTIFERRVVAVNNLANTAASNNDANQTMNTIWIASAIAAAVALALALYFMFRKTEAKTKSLATELRYESGILKL